jgi:limonene-1,2-epoxide hydrolase
MTPEAIVRDFCNAVPRRDIEELLAFFAADAVYHNIPVAPVRGHEAIAGVLRQFLGPASFAEFEIRNLAACGDAVLTERVDRFEIGGKRIELPVMGAFEVGSDGRIRAWRDYFDLAQFTKQMG